MFLSTLVWDIQPIFLRLGPFRIGYYGVFFASTLLLGFFLFQRYMRRRGYTYELCSEILLYSVLAVIAGARLVHCLIYHPDRYLADPLSILQVWRGGVASHGAGAGLVIVAILVSWRKRIPFLVLSDGVVHATAVATVFVRLGNFFNSEIVGRATTVPWGVIFARRDDVVRHPSQLYEATGGLVVLFLILFLARKGRAVAPGVLTGVFLVGYFTFRFLIEFVKEYHTLSDGLTMGQYLSIPFVLFGIIMLFRARSASPAVAEGD